MNEDWRKLAENYDDKDWAFSSAKAWENVVKENPTEYNKVQYADQLRLSGDCSKAKEVFDSVIVSEIPSKYHYIYYSRFGLLYQDRGELEEAIKCYRKSIEYRIDDTYPYVFLAAALSNRGKLEEVENVLLIALEKEGDIDEVNYNLSLNFARKGDFKKAIETMKKCLNIDPKYPNAKRWLEDFENMEKTNK